MEWYNTCYKCSNPYKADEMSIDNKGPICSECETKSITTYRLTKATRLVLDDGTSIVISPHNGAFMLKAEQSFDSITYKVECDGIIVKEVRNG